MIYIGGDLEGKEFNTRDGMAVEILRENNILSAIITGESHESVIRRASKLRIDEVYVGVKNKLEVAKKITEKFGFGLHQVAYIGDDLNDFEVMREVGVSVCVSDAVDEIKSISNIVLESEGGDGALREFVNLLLNSKNL